MDRLIDESSIKEIKNKFDTELKESVDVIIYSNQVSVPANEQEKQLADFTRKFLKELSEIDGRIEVEEKAMDSAEAKEIGISTSPSISLGLKKGYKIIFNGAPLGHEATSLIETITMLSGGDSRLSDEDKVLLKNADKKAKIQVFITPTCPYCPKSVILAAKIAIETKGVISAECVEAMENQQLSEKFNVGSVPQQVINSDPASITVGAQNDRAFIMQVLKYSSPEKAAALEAEAMKIKTQKEKLTDSPKETIYVTDGNFKQALAKYPALVVDCWAEWCMPCKMLSPTIDQLAQEEAGKIVFAKLNVDENRETAEEHGIMSIPTVMVFKNGVKTGEIVGVQPKPMLLSRIQELLK
ncbi:MAG: thioredoxin [Candidatus Goldbacteria bacterium]|nr:thioredoxin [Candidatus Goldiibacteriota bacterium]